MLIYYLLIGCKFSVSCSRKSPFRCRVSISSLLSFLVTPIFYQLCVTLGQTGSVSCFSVLSFHNINQRGFPTSLEIKLTQISNSISCRSTDCQIPLFYLFCNQVWYVCSEHQPQLSFNLQFWTFSVVYWSVNWRRWFLHDPLSHSRPNSILHSHFRTFHFCNLIRSQPD